MKKLIAVCILLLAAAGPWALRAEDTGKREFWDAWEKGDYAAARESVLDVAAKSPGYFCPAYYLHSLALKNGDHLNMIGEEIGLSVTEQGIGEFRKDLARYLPAASPAGMLAEAIIKYVWDEKEKGRVGPGPKGSAQAGKRLGVLPFVLL